MGEFHRADSEAVQSKVGGRDPTLANASTKPRTPHLRRKYDLL